MLTTKPTRYKFSVRLYNAGYDRPPLEEHVYCNPVESILPLSLRDGPVKQEFALEKARFWTKAEGDKKRLQHIMIDHPDSYYSKIIYYYDGDAVEEAIKAAGQSQVVALIIVLNKNNQKHHRSAAVPLIPVFYVPEDVMRHAKNCKHSRVFLQEIEASRTTSPPPNDPNNNYDNCDETTASGKSRGVHENMEFEDETATFKHPLELQEDGQTQWNDSNDKQSVGSHGGATASEKTSDTLSRQEASWEKLKDNEQSEGRTVARKQEHEEAKGKEEGIHAAHAGKSYLDAAQQRNQEGKGHTVADEHNPEQKKGIVHKAFNAAKDAVVTFFGLQHEVERLLKEKGWTEAQELRSYRLAMDSISNLATDRGGAESISAKIPGFLEHSDGNVAKLAFAAHLWTYFSAFVWTETKHNGKDLVLKAIVACLQGNDFSRLKPNIKALHKHCSKPAQKPHIVMGAFFKEMVKQPLVQWGTGMAKFWLNVLVLWGESDLFASPIDWECWEYLRAALGTDYYRRCGADLMRVLPERRFHTYTLFLQNGITDAHHAVMEIKYVDSAEKDFCPEPVGSEMLKQLAKRIIVDRGANTKNELMDFFVVLEACQFSKHSESKHKEVINECASLCKYRDSGTFSVYQLVADGSKSLPSAFRQELLQKMREQLRSDFRTKTNLPSSETVVQFLRLPICHMLVNDRDMAQVLFGFCSAVVMVRGTSFRDQLLVFDSIYSRVAEPLSVEGKLLDAIKDCTVLHTPAAIITGASEAATSSRKAFVEGSRGALFSKNVAKVLAMSISKYDLLTEPQLKIAANAIIAGNSHADFPFCRDLARCLEKSLIDQCDTMAKTVDAFTDLAGSGESGTAYSRLAFNIFAISFEKWKPQCLRGVLTVAPQVMAKFFLCFKATLPQGDDCPEPLEFLQCEQHVKGIVETFLTSFESDQLDLEQLTDGLYCSQQETWQAIENALNWDLPSAESLQTTIELCNSMVDSIGRHLSAPIDWAYSIRQVLKSYSCEEGQRTELGMLFSSYRVFIEREPGDTQSLQPEKRPLNAISLRRLQQDERSASGFKSEFAETLSICELFLRTPSYVFQDRLSKVKGGNVTVFELRKGVQLTSQVIADLFDGQCPLGEIMQAALTVTSGGRSLDEEVAVLRKCDAFSITQEGADRFLTCALMCRLAAPVNGFVNFCEHHGFPGLVCDQDFGTLKSLANGVFGEERCNIPAVSCDQACRQLCQLLGFELDAGSLDSNGLELILPIFDIFSGLYRGDIWVLAREKLWFGDEGLKSFYQEYGNVTNVLLGNSTDMYNMSILSLLEPAIRIVALLGGLQSEVSMSYVLGRLRLNSDIQKCIEGGHFREDLDVLQRNKSTIRRWFCDGVDEIASFYREFKAVCSTGVFSIDTNCDGKRKFLSLKYMTRDGDNHTEERSLAGESLETFVEQVGMIDNEQREESVSNEVEGFLKQFHCVLQAAKHVSVMCEIGFEESGIETFKISAGADRLREAEAVLDDLTLRSEQSKAWLTKIRASYPISLLFWKDELREIYHLLHDQKVGMLLSKVSRLLPSSRRLSEATRLVDVATKLSRGNKSTGASGASSWLVEVSKFLEELHDALGAPVKSNGRQRCEMELHSLSCDDDLKAEAGLTVMQHIYKDRLPEEFEVLDGLAPGLDDRLPVFLQRIQTFSGHTFVITNAEGLRGEQAKAVRDLLSDKANVAAGMRLHCIQRQSTVLGSSVWAQQKQWKNANCVDSTSTSSWSRHIVDGSTIMEATVVISKTCGAGKTRFIRKIQNELMSSEEKSEVASIVVHEQSTSSKLAAALAAKFTHANADRCLHVSLTGMPPSADMSRWLRELNLFFFSFFVLRVVHDTDASLSFHTGHGRWKIYVELPTDLTGVYRDIDEFRSGWLRKNLPILATCCRVREPPSTFYVDEDTRRVCTYLRAYEDGSINDKFEQACRKRIVFVLDRSESMEYDIDEKTQLSVATDCALGVFDSHVKCEDMVGAVLFNHQIATKIPMQTVRDDAHKYELRLALDAARGEIPIGGKTRMYDALEHVMREVEAGPVLETWILCLTDGDSDGSDQGLRQRLEQSPRNLHLIVVGVNLDESYEYQMCSMCQKYRPQKTSDIRGFYVSCDATAESMEASFMRVSKEIPVSQTFDLMGKPSDDECRQLIRRHVPDMLRDGGNMQVLAFWIRFLFRRVKVFDENDEFNFNDKHERMGTTLMRTMLSEVHRLVETTHNLNLFGKSYAQLIYDFSTEKSPEFRLLCTSPSLMEESLRQEYEDLDLPGFGIPLDHDLRQRSTLDRFISQAMGVPLNNGVLACIDEQKFVLTLDFTVKLLNIHERVASACPCILEGETGVSKTALTRMYSILRNSALEARAKISTAQILATLEQEVIAAGYAVGGGPTPSARLVEALELEARKCLNDKTELSELLFNLLSKNIADRLELFEAPPSCLDNCKSVTVARMIEWFSSSKLEKTFFEVNIHAALSEEDLLTTFMPMRNVARKLKHLNALVVVFLDEINTSSVMGLLKEIVVDRMLNGELLEGNIVAIAACNPIRKNLLSLNANPREMDLGRAWSSGHYQVVRLPPSMEEIRWSFGSLDARQEKEFIFQRLQMLTKDGIPSSLQMTMTEVIAAAQESTRQFACRNIEETLRRQQFSDEDDIKAEARARSKSVVSLRDIQRVFCLFDFFWERFLAALVPLLHRTQENAMLLSIAVVYYLRLDSKSRNEFLTVLQRQSTLDLQGVLDAAMNAVVAESQIPSGIALTRGLKENMFMSLVSSLSRTPLMIVGPPGSSKTLSINVVGDNANGEDSTSLLYKQFARLSLFHYQCSKDSSSADVLSVYQRATQRQETVDPREHQCVVFMDEAGLPEEGRESLKVLHYLLEGHMSVKSPVGFVLITNHVLDAAKSNRCVMLLRQEPDTDEMSAIAEGVLFGCREDGALLVREVDCTGRHFEPTELTRRICASYLGLMRSGEDLPWFETFFGLRDFIHFLKCIRSRSNFNGLKMSFSLQDILHSVERNFNGIELHYLKQIAAAFILPLSTGTKDEVEFFIKSQSRLPFDVLTEALMSNDAAVDFRSRARFKLIIDCSEDDSIMRILHLAGLLDISKKSLFKLSQMPEGESMEKLRIVSGVKFAALRGGHVVLSQTESLNESFYDLFNQNFRAIKGPRGKVSLYANIASGGVSRRSLVDSDFKCIVHIRESQLSELPAPFLNRFEKFRVDINDVVGAGWSRLQGMTSIMQKSRENISQLIALLGGKGMFAWVNNGKTIDSVYAGLLPNWTLSCHPSERSPSLFTPDNNDDFATSLAKFLRAVLCTSHFPREEIISSAAIASACLPLDQADTLRTMLTTYPGQLRADVGQHLMIILAKNADIPVERQDQLISILEAIMQIVITRHAMNLLLRIATPETVFAHRHLLPPSVVDMYFSLEHFSLQKLIRESLVSAETNPEAARIVAYTRTDTSLISIPVHSPARGASVVDSSVDRRTIQALVWGQLDDIIVEHLSLLQSESLIRQVAQSWVQDKSTKVFVMIVDMNVTGAVDRVNFIRCLFEQLLAGAMGKLFLVLLHYPPSNSIQRSCYPALFLGGWKHVFLDGVGHTGPSLGVTESFQIACKSNPASEVKYSTSQLCQSLATLMPRVLSHMACRNVLYPKQGIGSLRDATPFSVRSQFLNHVMNTRDGGSSVGGVLCHKFAHLWLNEAIEKTIKTAASRVLNGNTQLSVRMSMHSTLVEAFDKYMLWALKEMNEWQNLDILTSGSKEAVRMFLRILHDIVVPPFEELMLQQETRTAVRPVPLVTEGLVDGRSAKFPFFFLVSTCIDEFIENAAIDSTGGGESTAIQDLLSKVMEARVDPDDGSFSGSTSSNQERLVRSVVDFIMFSGEGDGPALFQLYLSQFIEWKAGCSCNQFVLLWMRRNLLESRCGRNIVAVHCIEKCRHIEFMKVSSWSMMAQRHFPQFWKLAVGRPPEIIDLHWSEWPKTLFLESLANLESSVNDDNIDRLEWSNQFTLLRQQLNSSDPYPEEILARFRVLFLFDLLIGVSADQHTQTVVIARWYDTDRNMLRVETQNHATLAHLYESIEGNQSIEKALLWQFFSPFTMSTMSLFHAADLEFVLEAIDCGRLRRHSYHFIESLLLRACKFAPTEVSTCLDGCLELPMTSLQRLNRMLLCDRLAEFTEDGRRTAVPHFIPVWLAAQGAGEASLPSRWQVFFSTYENSFDCSLAGFAFSLILGQMLRKTAAKSSSDLLRLVINDIESEESLDLSTHARLSLLRAQELRSESLVGSALGAMIADARIVCFVVGLARDVAENAEVSALSEPYSEISRPLLDHIMSLPNVRFQDLFYSLILQQRGEACLMRLLDRGPLSDLPWCRTMKDGMPSFREGQENALQEAEDALAEALQDEQRKSQTLKLCPRCRRPFEVLARECGQFVCGQNAHGLVGREIHGCGHPFQVDTADRYVVDEGELAPKRQAVQIERANLKTFNDNEQGWTRAKDMTVPMLRFAAEKLSPSEEVVPYAFVIGDVTLDSSSECLKIFLQGSSLEKYLSLLPDLIEFYVWIHNTFRYLLTKDQAMNIAAGDIMKKERLQRRFDPTHVVHLLSLWGRLQKGLAWLLVEMDYQTSWDCQRVHIPFETIEKSPLMYLLSEGAHPTDGFDILFLIINEIIGKFNSYSQRLSKFRGDHEYSPKVYSLHPKFIMAGSGGAVTVNELLLLSRLELDTTVQGCWDEVHGVFNMDDLNAFLRLATSLQPMPPLILNPLDCLREPFLFQVDTTATAGCPSNTPSIWRSPAGYFFAREGDMKLADSAHHRLTALDATKSDGSIRRTLCIEFHHALNSHEDVRKMLEGVRNLLDLLATEEVNYFGTIEQALQVVFADQRGNFDDPPSMMINVGFPEMRVTQVEFLFSLTPEQLVELVQYLALQLASEAYLYAQLPISMAEPLSEELKNYIRSVLSEYGDDTGSDALSHCLNEFVQGVLALYEREIRDAAETGDQPLKTFLSSNNFCGDEDAIFSLLPNAVMLSHYIALQQLLQQYLLGMSYDAPPQGEEDPVPDAAMAWDKFSDGRFWLWQEGAETRAPPIPMHGVHMTRNQKGSMWFECTKVDNPASDAASSSDGKGDAVEFDDANIVCVEEGDVQVLDDDAGLPVRSASRIQTWWRHHIENRKSTSREVDIDNDDDTSSNMDVDDPSGDFTMIEGNDGNNDPDSSFGSWLAAAGLPVTAAEFLNNIGVRSVDDVHMVLTECDDILEGLAKLDIFKLKRAAGSGTK